MVTFCHQLLVCRVCGNSHGLIRKYGLMCCRQCFHSNAKEIGFIKTSGAIGGIATSLVRVSTEVLSAPYLHSNPIDQSQI